VGEADRRKEESQRHQQEGYDLRESGTEAVEQ